MYVANFGGEFDFIDSQAELRCRSDLLRDADRADVPRGNKSGPFTLLYVEDNPAHVLLVAELVARRPHLKFLSAGDGLSGVELARRVLPDVILMDINLPGLSGLDAMSQLADDPLTADIPVVALSVHAMPNDIESGIAAGFFRYVTKPFKVRALMESLEAALDHAQFALPRGHTDHQIMVEDSSVVAL